MQLFEMQGLLAGKCLPGDMFVGESLAQYLLRQLNQRDELVRQVSALQTSQDNIINGLGIKGDGPVSKLVIEYVMGLVAERDALAAENACLKQDIDTIAEVMETGTDGALFSAVDEAVSLNTPDTDSVLARIKAQGVDELADHMELNGFTNEAAGTREFAANLRKEVKDKELMDVIDSMGGSGNKAARRAANLRAGRKG